MFQWFHGTLTQKTCDPHSPRLQSQRVVSDFFEGFSLSFFFLFLPFPYTHIPLFYSPFLFFLWNKLISSALTLQDQLHQLLDELIMLMNPRTYRSRDEVTPRKQQRNRILEIGKPIEFEHGIHVEFNRERGKFMASFRILFLFLLSPILPPLLSFGA